MVNKDVYIGPMCKINARGNQRALSAQHFLSVCIKSETQGLLPSAENFEL